MLDPEIADGSSTSQQGSCVEPRTLWTKAWPLGIGIPSPLVLALFAAGMGIVLRVDGLDRKSLWAEEVVTANFINLPSLPAMIGEVYTSLFASFYYSLLWLWSRILGPNDSSLRSLASTFGILTLPTTYLVWRPIVGRRAAAWCIVLLALSANHIYCSQDATIYSAGWLQSVVASGALINALMSIGTSQLKWFALFGAATALSPMISFVSVELIGAQIIYGLILMKWHPKRRWAVLDAAVVLTLGGLASIIPSLFLVTGRTSTGEGLKCNSPLSLSEVPRELYRYLDIMSFGYRPSSEHPVGLLPELLDWILLPCTMVVVGFLASTIMPSDRWLAFGVGWWRRGEPRPISLKYEVYLMLWLIFPITTTIVVSLMSRTYLEVPRYLFSSAPALTIWVGVALSRLRRIPSLCLALAFLMPNLASVTFDRTNYTRVPWRQLTACLAGAAASVNLERSLRSATIVPNDSVLESDPTLAIVTLPGLTLDRNSLAYAWRHNPVIPSRIQPSFIGIKEALAKRRPFVIVTRYSMGTTSARDMGTEVEQATGTTWYCWMVFKEQVYEDPCTATASPYKRNSLEAWFCTPKLSKHM